MQVPQICPVVLKDITWVNVLSYLCLEMQGQKHNYWNLLCEMTQTDSITQAGRKNSLKSNLHFVFISSYSRKNRSVEAVKVSSCLSSICLSGHFVFPVTAEGGGAEERKSPAGRRVCYRSRWCQRWCKMYCLSVSLNSLLGDFRHI